MMTTTITCNDRFKKLVTGFCQ